MVRVFVQDFFRSVQFGSVWVPNGEKGGRKGKWLILVACCEMKLQATFPIDSMPVVRYAIFSSIDISHQIHGIGGVLELFILIAASNRPDCMLKEEEEISTTNSFFFSSFSISASDK